MIELDLRICDPPREKGPFDAHIFFAFFYTSELLRNRSTE